ncbi:oligosaccharide flippase family protein [Vibrio tubiashii]|uniref:oligosaccharide flippase family protein n=1 Tax=Vibrio tubiashii TaxID=29498 RepID=UPI00234F215F|nr:oligosaccharide flippase family protein [Vibrio tubiashii]WCP67290.1 oligosaccharide flippase family protein [Vibrio tubiashii]
MNLIKKNAVYLYIVQGAQYLVPLIVLPLLARALGTEGVGLVSVALSVCALTFVVTDFGFSISSPALIAQNKKLSGWIDCYLGSVLFIKLFLLTVLILVLLIVGMAYTDFAVESPLIFWSVILTICLQGLQFQWLFHGLEKMYCIVLSVGSSKFVYLILVILFVRQPGDEGKVLLFFSFSQCVALALGVFLLYKAGFKVKFPTVHQLIQTLKLSVPFFMSRGAVSLYTSTNPIVVGSFSGYHQAAIYTSAEKLYQAILSISGPITQALFPHLARTREDELLIRFLLGALPLVTISALSIGYFSEEIIETVFGEAFIEAEKLLRVFALTSVVSFIAVNFGYPAYSTINRLDMVNRSVFIGGGFQVLLLGGLFIFNAISAISIALSFLAVEVLVMLYRLYFFFRLRGQHSV